MAISSYFVFKTRIIASKCHNINDLIKNHIYWASTHADALAYMKSMHPRHHKDLELLSYDNDNGSIRYASFVL